MTKIHASRHRTQFSTSRCGDPESPDVLTRLSGLSPFWDCRVRRAYDAHAMERGEHVGMVGGDRGLPREGAVRRRIQPRADRRRAPCGQEGTLDLGV